MATSKRGIRHRPIDQSPIAIIDFETTGLTPGIDRVVEVSVVRVDPAQSPRLIFDTLVNPRRPVAATEIHGITDEDVADAPYFEDVAGDLIRSLSGCVVAAYNVYFDARFLSYELGRAGLAQLPPHFCLMYMRPLLGLGGRCKLDEACRCHGIDHQSAHMAAADAQASGRLFLYYLDVIRTRKISTFGDLARLGDYKFFESFDKDPLAGPGPYELPANGRPKSRCGYAPTATQPQVDPTRQAIAAYWDALKTVLADLRISEAELTSLANLRDQLQIKDEHLRLLHARAFASAIVQFTDDQSLDEREATKLNHLHACLQKLGWAPGQ